MKKVFFGILSIYLLVFVLVLASAKNIRPHTSAHLSRHHMNSYLRHVVLQPSAGSELATLP